MSCAKGFRMSVFRWVAVMALASVSCVATAESLFDRVKLSAAEQHVKDQQDSVSGFQVSIEKSLAQEFLVGVSYEKYQPEFADSIEHVNAYVGLFAAVEHMPQSQVAAMFGVRQSTLADADIKIDDKAAMIGVSLRNRFYENVELQGDLEYLNWDKGESGFAGLLSASYFFTHSVSSHVQFRKQGDSEFFAIGLGWYF